MKMSEKQMESAIRRNRGLDHDEDLTPAEVLMFCEDVSKLMEVAIANNCKFHEPNCLLYICTCEGVKE